MSAIRSLVGERQALRVQGEAVTAAVRHVASYGEEAQAAVAARLSKIESRTENGMLDGRALAFGKVRIKLNVSWHFNRILTAF